ncbi:hypothetical protein BJ508DRAFT_11379 [Ascobolus immersus RN42]|uniref:Uncharacterized protein n=1 Tax=Ascobolus immersus RN42 TaxID=1160509 RepID=A0A3N4HW68_ASCIM|nr:hypothetical protein BJ508DRAFT_11379 [Ascobolus immersus RN42]
MVSTGVAYDLLIEKLTSHQGECDGYFIKSEADVGGIGVLVGFTITALLLVSVTIARWQYGMKVVRHLKIVPSNCTEACILYSLFRKHRSTLIRRRRSLSKSLLSLCDFQLTATTSLLLAGHIYLPELSSYHRQLVYTLASFLQSTTFIVLIFLEDSLLDRDVILREGILAVYYTLYLSYGVRISGFLNFNPVLDPRDSCYKKHLIWPVISDARATFFTRWVAWHSIVVFLSLYAILRRKVWFVKLLAAALDWSSIPFEWVATKMRQWMKSCTQTTELPVSRRTESNHFDNTNERNRAFRMVQNLITKLRNLRNSVSSTISKLVRFFFQKGALVIIVGLFTLWGAYDTWVGLFIPNEPFLRRKGNSPALMYHYGQPGSDFDWGFGQILAISTVVGQCILQFSQHFSGMLSFSWAPLEFT